MSQLTNQRTTTRSGELFELAGEHLAGGVGSGTRSPRSGWKPHPIFVEHGSGSHVCDVDGNQYIDYQMGQGPLIQIEAVRAQAAEMRAAYPDLY